jgi:hypothetical protein
MSGPPAALLGRGATALPYLAYLPRDPIDGVVAFTALPRGGITKTRAAARRVLTLLEGGDLERAAAALRQFL